MKVLRMLSLMLALALLVGMLPATAEAAPQYWIGVDVKNQRTTIYRVSDNSVVHRWLCTTGASSTPTPQGTFYLPAASGSERQEWFAFTARYVKYAVRYTRRLYFHSVLFKRMDDNSMCLSTLRRLGRRGSAGCIRLEVQHAKWICDNCPTGTKVVIHSGVDDPRITALLGGQAGIDTTPSLPAPPIVTGLTLDRSGTVRLNVGETLQLNCAVEPANAPTALRWKSSKPSKATVSESGLVTGVASGLSTVSVTSSNGVKASVTIDVVDPNVARSVAIEGNRTVYVNVGETLQLTARVDPASAASALTWKSSKPGKAVVNGSGLVTGISKGTAKITVTTANRKRAVVTVKVLDPNAPGGVSFAQKGPLTLRVGETLKLTPELSPATARTTYTWTSSKKGVASVDGSGVVTAVRKGKAKITVRTANGKKATVVVRVVE